MALKDQYLSLTSVPNEVDTCAYVTLPTHTNVYPPHIHYNTSDTPFKYGF